MAYNAIPALGTEVLLAFPDPYVRSGSGSAFLVADVRDRQVTLHCEQQRGFAKVPSGIPCLVSWVTGDHGSTREAIVVASTASALIVDVAPDPRRHPRYRRPCAVRVDAPYSGVVVEGVAEDISVGGVRVRTARPLVAGSRVFVSLLVADGLPVVAIADVRSSRSSRHSPAHVARLVFTLIAPSHAARLAAFLEWPEPEPATRGLALENASATTT